MRSSLIDQLRLNSVYRNDIVVQWYEIVIVGVSYVNFKFIRGLLPFINVSCRSWSCVNLPHIHSLARGYFFLTTETATTIVATSATTTILNRTFPIFYL